MLNWTRIEGGRYESECGQYRIVARGDGRSNSAHMRTGAPVDSGRRSDWRLYFVEELPSGARSEVELMVLEDTLAHAKSRAQRHADKRAERYTV